MTFFYVYIIRSELNGSLYIGFTENLKNRLLDHNSGKNLSTKYSKPWRLIYFEGYLNKQDALGREQFLKSGSGRKYINKQLTSYFLDET